MVPWVCVRASNVFLLVWDRIWVCTAFAVSLGYPCSLNVLRPHGHGLFEKSIKVTVRRTAFSMGEDCTFDFIQYNILLDLFRVFGLMIRNVRSTSDYFRPFEAWRGLRCKRIRQ